MPSLRPLCLALLAGTATAFLAVLPAAPHETPPRQTGVPLPNMPTPVPPKLLPDGRTQLALIDFGPWVQAAPWRVPFGSGRRDRYWGWHGGMVRQRTRLTSAYGPLLGDFVEGEEASFSMCVEPREATYRMELHLGDPEMARGPVEITSGGRTLVKGVRTEAGESKMVTLELNPDERGWISIRVVAGDCGSWALQAADLWGPRGAQFVPLYPEVDTRSAVPPPDSLAALEVPEARRVLADYCDFLLEWRPADGGFSESGAWYQNAYPVRTLLAGGILLDRPEYREAAFLVLDRFCNEQRPTGGWYSGYFGRDGCGLATQPDTSSSNLADIGTMSLCLALAAPHADPVRAQRYLAAATRYADEVVLPAQAPEGWFPNGLFMGRDHAHPYSVATACQAGSLGVLGAVTGELRYRQAAERAGLWLADTFRDDGSILFAPHDTSRVKLLEPTAFGDLFYLVEGLGWAETCAVDSGAAARMRRALDSYLVGTGGVRARALQGYWFPPNNLWSDSKMGGLLYLLVRHAGPRGDASLETWKSRIFSWLADAGLSRRIGVLAPPPSLTGDYALAATGFAGIGIAALIDPDVLVPPAVHRRAGEAPSAIPHRPR